MLSSSEKKTLNGDTEFTQCKTRMQDFEPSNVTPEFSNNNSNNF